MKGAGPWHLLPSLCLLAVLLLSACAGPPKNPSVLQQKSVIVLLPEGDQPSGEVVVSNAAGVRVLNQSWQSVEVAGARGEPGQPVVQRESAVQHQFQAARAGMPALPVHFQLYFKLDSAQLLPESELLLPEIVETLRKRAPAQLSVVGHADSTGSIKYNYQLGLLRATTIAGLLAKMGASAASVETSSRGKSEPQVKTPDQTPEPRNRRAEVTVR
jgi:outer membrane protein OmpA-like peptidoglycan-associated protein